VGGKKLKHIAGELRRLRPLIEEANELSRKRNRSDVEFRFEEEVVFNTEEVDEEVRPEDFLVIRVLVRPLDRPKFRTAYLWNFEKFEARLDLMREMTDSSPTGFEGDPWIETPVARIGLPPYPQSVPLTLPEAVKDIRQDEEVGWSGLKDQIKKTFRSLSKFATRRGETSEKKTQ
jgi:hypothetical protein